MNRVNNIIVFQSEAITSDMCVVTHGFDLITLIYELDLDISKMCWPTENEISRWRFSNVRK